MKLIDKEKLLERVICSGSGHGFVTESRVYEAPEVDPVHAAGGCYCRECKWASNTRCLRWGGLGELQPDDFCSRGERMEDEDDENE